MTAPVDRAVEREKFEAQFPVPRDCIWCGNGYSATEYNAWDAHKHHDRWIGWFMRAELSAQTLASKEAEIARITNCVKDALACFQAAEIEGLSGLIAEADPQNPLKDLLSRRLMFVPEYLLDALTQPPKEPT